MSDTNSNNDLDFDELDKAVTSLMGGVKDKDPDAKEQNLDINTTLGPDESPRYNNLDEIAGSIGSETIDRPEQTVSLSDEPEGNTEQPGASANVPALKRSGRFMDVVHPSSDMRTRSTSPQVSHEGASIAAPSSSLDTTEGNLPASTDAPVVQNDEDEESSVVLEPKEPPQSVEKPSEPLNSPFLPDAKVEKRPLGGLELKPVTEEANEPMVVSPESTPEPEATSSLKGQSEEKLPTEPEEAPSKKDEDEFSKMDAMTEPAQNLEEVNEHIPEEYKNELLEVEKNLASPLADEFKPTVSHEEPVASAAPVTPVVASIPKQYQEKPSTSEATNGAIYDTDTYHKPVNHPAKQKSGWMWAIATVVLVIIGGLLGAAAFLLGAF